MSDRGPRLDRSYALRFFGDWGQANFHRICGWLSQEFCDRAGAGSFATIRSLRDGGMESLACVSNGEADLCIATPTMMLADALTGEGIFGGRSLSALRCLATLPQNDRMLLAIRSDLGVATFAELRAKKPALRIATSVDDGTNFIGYAAARFMAEHGLDDATIRSWGGEYVRGTRPEQSLFRMQDGEVDAVVQEAIMTPWWQKVVENGRAIIVPAETDALDRLVARHRFRRNSLPTGIFPETNDGMATLDFSDFAIIVRDDMREDIAHLLTWCLVETRAVLEGQYRHLPPARSPVSWPIVPANMKNTPLPLHEGAERYYREGGLIS